MSESKLTTAVLAVLMLVAGLSIGVLVGIGGSPDPAGSSSGSSSGRPVLGTDACFDVQAAYARSLPDREPYDSDEEHAVYAHMDDLCDQPGRITK